MNGSNLNQPNKRYMPGLDGLRALSVLAVIAYHLDLKWAQGGLLGVGIFFVLSGYLITDQLILELKTHQKVSLANFWIRRIRRLLPAMACMLAFTAVWLISADPSWFQALKGNFLSSLFYVNNWYLIFHEVSYFESFGPPSPIGHLWSLSIEEQFYLIWPLVLVLGIKLIPRRGRLLLWMLGGAILSAFVMAVIYEPGTDPSRVYYGTDTRAFALLVGAALALIWPSWKINGGISSSARTLLDVSGGLGIAVLILLMVNVSEYDDWLYRGGFFVISLLTALVIAVLVHPASRVGGVMGCKPLTWIGKRSYSLYIWHYPVVILSKSAVQVEVGGFAQLLLPLAASFLLSALSYKYIEEPIRQGRFRARVRPVSRRALNWNQHIQGGRTKMKRNGWKPWIIATMIIALGGGYLSTHSQANPMAKAKATSPASERVDAVKQNNRAGGLQSASSPKQQPLTGEGITVIGDSVIIGVEPYLKEKLPKVTVDGKVGRQMSQAGKVVDELKAQEKLGDRVIIELGTNGPFSKKQLRALLQSLSETERVYLVTARVPKGWQDTVNENIKSVADEFSNVTIIDWHAASQGKDEYFYKDGVHLKPEGGEYYASLMAEALRE